MEHPSTKVRQRAMAVCIPTCPRESFGPGVARSLTQLVEAEPDVLGQPWATRLLYRLARQKDSRISSPALDFLAKLAETGRPLQRLSAVQALARHGDSSSLEALETVFDSDADAFTQGHCLLGIARIRGRDGAPLLQKSLSDPGLLGYAAPSTAYGRSVYRHAGRDEAGLGYQAHHRLDQRRASTSPSLCHFEPELTPNHHHTSIYTLVPPPHILQACPRT